jgi:hypothetical protein
MDVMDELDERRSEERGARSEERGTVLVGKF